MEIKEGFTIPILDHGYIKFIEYWGKDERVIESARMSTGKGFLKWDAGECPICYGEKKLYSGRFSQNEQICYGCNGKGTVVGDMKLLSYLNQHKHFTPFEMAGCVIEVQAPIAVFREWHRHRTFSYNEMSARYTAIPDVNYMPTVDRCLMVNGKNRQAGAIAGANELTHESVLEWLEELSDTYKYCEKTYQSGLQRGLPKELARMCMPVGRYSRMRAQAVLRNWLAFLTLRMDETAQYEIRMFANAVGGILKVLFPRVWSLFIEGKPYQPLDLDKEIVA